ncbi:MAG: hypothetical protein AAF264_14215 [Pseudomonadota bacterium]
MAGLGNAAADTAWGGMLFVTRDTDQFGIDSMAANGGAIGEAAMT